MKARKKILFLVAHRPGRSPGQRFRFEQYLNYLEENGFDCHISYLINEKDDAIFYAPWKLLSKTIFLIKSLIHRKRDLATVSSYDMVFLYREAHMLGTTWFERRIKKAGVKMVVDFDDSIWLKDVSNGNRHLAFLKKPGKTAEIVGLCDAIIVGNQYLADYARQYNSNVFVIPTTIDTDYYVPKEVDENSDRVCIGWTGSSTTLKHFSLAVPVLRKLREKYGERLTFRLISDELFEGELPGLENVRWNKDSEVKDLVAIDIGIMPLPDDAWSRGKCGFKGLQYMALGKPAVMSPVGVNTEIIEHGRNGFLAQTHEEWEKTLSQLIDNPSLRKKIGEQGRKTVVERFSFHSQKDRYVKIYHDVTGGAI
ncbi:MAG: glycosyltransferase family 4 protein [bacterium]